MLYRPYNPEKDCPPALRIYREVGWSDGNPEREEGFRYSLASGRVMVADIAGEPECLVLTKPGAFRYLREDLPADVVCNVVTSYVARRQGLASRLAAASLARDAADGALLAVLGIFDQGFYDKLGFGTGSYEHWVSFDPAQLKVSVRHRVPQRLNREEWEAIHAARLARLRRHGAISLLPPQVTRGELIGARNGFGFVYRDGPGGELSHGLWGSTQNVARVPYFISWLFYRTGEQFLELMALLKSLGDQVRQVTFADPAGMQLQALLDQPFKQRELTEKGNFEACIRAVAWWQIRINDLAGCLARTHLPGGSVRFNLCLSDPVAKYLPAGSAWPGAGGDYVVTLGPSSGAERGTDPALPTLTATVNSFSRLWIGVAPATGLAAMGELSAPLDLLEALDDVLRLPCPLPDWRF
jgi:hypothetical protein